MAIKSILSRVRPVIDIAATLAMLAAATAILLNTSAGRAAPREGRPNLVAPSTPVTLSDTAVLGSEQAQIGLVVYSDFQCPFCAKFSEGTLPSLRTEFIDTNQLRIAFRHLPLEIHPMARRAAESAECARRQSLFWPMHDVLFEGAANLTEQSILSAAERVGLNLELFRECTSGGASATVASDIASAAALGIRGTPSFLLGRWSEDGSLKVTEVFAGALPSQVFAEKIKRTLAIRQ